jgi:hypothetical protein
MAQGGIDQALLPSGGFVLHAMNGAVLRRSLREQPLALERGRVVADALAGTDLTVELPSGESIGMHVDGVQEQPNYAAYVLSVGGHPVCAGSEPGIFIDGAWDARGKHVARPGTVTYACNTGVIAKCVAWGYAPWSVGSDVHQTCTRLARADYCGTGEAWTREGTLVNIYDSLGVQVSEPSSELSFEAGWGPSGAVCVRAPRYRVSDDDGAAIEPACWSGLPRCGSLAEVQSMGGILANDSAHAQAAACGR